MRFLNKKMSFRYLLSLGVSSVFVFSLSSCFSDSVYNREINYFKVQLKSISRDLSILKENNPGMNSIDDIAFLLKKYLDKNNHLFKLTEAEIQKSLDPILAVLKGFDNKKNMVQNQELPSEIKPSSEEEFILPKDNENYDNNEDSKE